MLTYNSYRSYLKKRFGRPILKIPLSGGFSCPNRDGSKSSSGCSFCDNRAFSPVALQSQDVLDQLHASIARFRSRYDLFIGYFQPFSNTYGSVERLTSLYEPVIATPGVIGCAIGTRPDCLSPEIVAYLADLNRRTYLSVELGLQSGCDATLLLNNRGHTVEEFSRAVRQLDGAGIETVAHVILGLPGDTTRTMMATARLLANLPVKGIKIHQLMIVRGTLVEQWYREGSIEPLSVEEYAGLVAEFCSYLRPDQLIHRLMADSTEAAGLIAPGWSTQKNRVIAFITDYMQTTGIRQGLNYYRL